MSAPLSRKNLPENPTQDDILNAAAVASAAPQPFNILFVLSDDHSVPHMGCYGDPNVATPNYDRFARIFLFPEN